MIEANYCRGKIESIVFQSHYFRRLFLPSTLLVGAAVAIVGFIGAEQLHRSYMETMRLNLHDESALAAMILVDDLAPEQRSELQANTRRIGQAIARRITIITEDGTVIADNQAVPGEMENHRLRPEIITAAARGTGEDIRPSETLHTNLLYFAQKIQNANGQIHYLRLAVSLDKINHYLNGFRKAMVASALAAIFAASAIFFLYARNQTRPLTQLTRFAEAVRDGDLSQRLRIRQSGEIGTLSSALNSMADSLGRLIGQARHDHGQLVAMLSSLSEGVIATDTRQRVLLSNDAAKSLLNLDAAPVEGQMLWEVIFSKAILEAASQVLASHARRHLLISPIAGTHVQVTLCTFGASAKPQGLVIVLHDVTEATQYQELRKQFVANVSHELRTPLTAIAGFTETLRDGAINDPAVARKYLATIEKHAGQLSNLVNDLLELSRLESVPGLTKQTDVDIGQVIDKAVDPLLVAAQRKHQKLAVKVQHGLPRITVNPDYIQRAVSNLVDNAIKYTSEAGTISVHTHQVGSHLVIDVSDSGIGIPEQDQIRIFERFYRVDRSRSREMGGTGLGLSIVKHLVQVHDGTVEVTSQVGRGSTFSIRLPLTSPPA